MKVFWLFIGMLVSVSVIGQQKPYAQVYTVSNGTYTIQYFPHSIVKLTFTPSGYTKNEQVSDAVIAKPIVSTDRRLARVNGDMISFGGKAIMVNADTMSGMYGFNFALETDEKIFGGGERAISLNRRGYRFNLHNNPWYGYSLGADNLNYSVPFFTSSKGYGLLFDNPSSGFVDIGKVEENIFKAGFSSGELSVYIIPGENYQEVLHAYHQLTGTQPLPPKWALGNLMSRFGYTSEKQTKDILAKMNAAKIPVEAIIFDLFWFGDSIKGTLGNLDWVNKQKWPDPKRMIADFKKQGIKTILVTEPFFVETAKNYQASKPYLAVDAKNKPYYLTDFYFGKGGIIDIFRNDSKNWFWNFYKKQMDLGVEAWWGDLGEPEKHPADIYHNLKDKGHARLFAANEVHNIYGHNWTKMLFEKFAVHYPNKRLFSLNRSGFAGSQRYSIFPWTGDVSRSWSGLQAQLPVLLGMSMSGVPYVHSDAGGFAGGEGDNELYVRWLQFAAYTPIFRPHGTALYEVEKQAFSFPSEAALIDEQYQGYARAAIYKRYAMMPYNYTLAYQQTKYGQPLMAPLYYHFPNDTTAVSLQDEYMWGENILVAPIIEKAQTERKYYLPEGKWFDMETMQMQNGGTWLSKKINIWDGPVTYYKAGSFTPTLYMNKKGEATFTNTTTLNATHINVLYVGAEKPSAFSLYEDDGASKNSLSTGKYELTTFSSGGIQANGVSLQVKSNKGSYTGKPAKRVYTFLVALGNTPAVKRIMVNGKSMKQVLTADNITLNNYVFVPGKNLLMLQLAFTGNPLKIDITW